MNEEELMRLDNVEEQGETTVNDPERFTKYTTSEVNKHSEDKQALLEAAQQDEEAAAAIAQQEAQAAEGTNPQGFLPDGPVNFLGETAKGVYGGLTDAVESAGSFLDLTGDTISATANRIMGLNQSYGNNPFNFKEYRKAQELGIGGAQPGILNVPDRFQPETLSGYGDLVRGLSEFGFLLYATGGAAKVLKPATTLRKAAVIQNKIGKNLLAGAVKGKTPIISKLAQTRKGARFIKFLPKNTAKLSNIAFEGGVADLISSSSDYGNLANLIDEYAPWLPLSEFLSVDPDEDNPWTARIKTVFAGAGANIVAHYLIAFGKARFAAIRKRKSGASIDEANVHANGVLDERLKNEVRNEYKQREELKKDAAVDGRGIPPDPWEDHVVGNLDEELGKMYVHLTKGNLQDVIGNDIFFHGSGRGLPGDFPYYVRDGRRWSDDNLMGNGFYTVDDITVAADARPQGQGLTISMDASGKKKVMYRVNEREPVNFFDADRQFDFDGTDPEIAAFKRAGFLQERITDKGLELGPGLRNPEGNPEFVSAWPTEGSISYSDYVQRIKDEQLYPREEVTQVLDTIHSDLQELGYGGIQYTANHGEKTHKVRVYWNPDTQIELDKYRLRNTLDPDVSTDLPIFDSRGFGVRPPRKPWQTNIEAGRGLEGSRGAEYLINRLRKKFVIDGLDPSEVEAIEDFINMMGDRFFGDVSLSITNKLGVQGRFNFGNRLVEIRRQIFETGDFTQTMIHELWHTLSRYLPAKDVKKLGVEFKNRKAKWLAAGGKDVELFKKGRYTPSNYRYKNLDEYFAETMSDEFDMFMVNYDQLAPEGTFKRITQEVAIFVKDLYASVASRLGGSQTRRIFTNYRKQLYENMQRKYTLELEQQGYGGWDPFIDDDDFITTNLDEFDNAENKDGFKSPRAEDLENKAVQKGQEIGDPWFDEEGATYSDTFGSKQVDPDRNPNMFGEQDKTFVPDDNKDLQGKATRVVKELLDEGTTNSQVLIHRQIERMADGSESLYKFIKEFSEKLANEIFDNKLNSFDYKKVQAAILRKSEELYSRVNADVVEGTNKNFMSYFDPNRKDNYIDYMTDGNQVITGTPEQKVALEMVISTLSKRASLYATGALELPPGAAGVRQMQHANKSLVLALKEYKKMSYMAGSTLERFKNKLMPEDARKLIEGELASIDEAYDEFYKELDRIAKNGNNVERTTLMEIQALSGGSVTTLDDALQWVKVRTKGGRYKGQSYRSGIREQAKGMFYNSVLSSLRTPIKAIVGTNFIALLRPFQTYVGAALQRNKKEMVIAAAQLHGISEMFAEGFKMFRHNWDLGINRKAQSYVGKFNVETNSAEFKQLGKFVEMYGTDSEKTYYAIANFMLDFNNSPWVRYSQNAMGAGDALARTLIGRFEMRMRAARKAIDDGVDLDDVVEVATRTEKNFREQIFKKDAYDMWVVSDRAAALAGDETALTKPLSGNLKGLESLSSITGFKNFFPFVRTGFNALDLTWQHTPGLARFNKKYRDLMEFANNGGKNAKQLEVEYGIRKEDIPQAIALMKGRVATGTMLSFMAFTAAVTGNMTGTLPYDKETRDHWRNNKIQPNSFKIGNTYISYGDMEPYNTILSAVANVAGYQNSLGEAVRDDMLQKIQFMFASVIVDKSMLAGVDDLAQVFSGNISEIQLGRIAAKFVRSQVPYSGLMGQLGNLMDENERIARGFWETTIRRDIGFKSFLAPKYDILTPGNKAQRFTPYTSNPLLKLWNSLSPVAISYAAGDPVKEALQSISYNLPEALRTWKGEELNSFEQSELQRYLAESNLYARLKTLVTSKQWKDAVQQYKDDGLLAREGMRPVDQRFYLQVQSIFLNEKKKAITKLRANNPDLYARIKDRELRRFYSKKGNYNVLNELKKHGI